MHISAHCVYKATWKWWRFLAPVSKDISTLLGLLVSPLPSQQKKSKELDDLIWPDMDSSWNSISIWFVPCLLTFLNFLFLLNYYESSPCRSDHWSRSLFDWDLAHFFTKKLIVIWLIFLMIFMIYKYSIKVG